MLAHFNELVYSLNQESGMQFVCADNELMWEQVCSQLTFCHTSYEWLTLCYQKAYFNPLLDASVVITWQNKPVAIWPLFIIEKEEKPYLTSAGGGIFEPLFIPSISLKTQKSLIKSCFNLLDKLVQQYQCDYEYQVDLFNNGLSLWGQQVFDKAGAAQALKVGYIDLSLSVDCIKSKFRSRYRSLINSGLKKWQVEVQDTLTDDFDTFHQLHIKVAGRKTRSDATWDWQKRMLKEKKAFLVLLKEAQEMIGGAIFTYNRSHCYYGVGVYRRDYFPQALGHVVQFKAIEHMKSLGIRWYEIGELFTKINTTDEKLKSIANFKSGFSTHQFIRLTLKSK